MSEYKEKVRAILDRHLGAGRDALIPILQEIQDGVGFLPREAIIQVGRHLDLPASKIYGVATFYSQFRFEPKGEHHFALCRGTACHVKGSSRLLNTLANQLKVKPGQTTRDRLFSLETVACMGACALSPVVCINDEFHAKVSPAKLLRRIEERVEKAREDSTAQEEK